MDPQKNQRLTRGFLFRPLCVNSSLSSCSQYESAGIAGCLLGGDNWRHSVYLDTGCSSISLFEKVQLCLWFAHMMTDLRVWQTVRHAGRAIPGLTLRSLFYVVRRFVIRVVDCMSQSKIGVLNMRSNSFMGICFMAFGMLLFRLWILWQSFYLIACTRFRSFGSANWGCYAASSCFCSCAARLF